MANWMDEYNQSTPKTKSFLLTWIVYALVLIITTVYCYARLDFVRSYKTPEDLQTNKVVSSRN